MMKRHYRKRNDAFGFRDLLPSLLLVGLVSAGSVYADTQAPADFEGLWAGQILYAPAEIELNIWVELGRDAEGLLVGNIDVPSQKMKFYPLTAVAPQGTHLTFDFFKDSEKTKNARFLFEGELSKDGEALKGMFTGWYDDEGRNHVPFELHRVAGAFGERPEPQLQPLHDLSVMGTELQQAFTEGQGHVRVVLFLSPT